MSAAASRRALLGGAAALAVPATAALATEAAGRVARTGVTHPDAVLVQLSAEFCALAAEYARVFTGEHDTGTPEELAERAATNAIDERQEAIADAMLDLPATTWEGHQAIARAVAAWSDPSDFARDDCLSERLIGALLRGLIGRVLADHHFPPMPLPKPGAAPAAARVPSDPDTELVQLCVQHVVNRNAYNARGGHLEPEDCPLWQAYARTLAAISEAKPQTFHGMMAKAAAAKVEAQERDGSENPENNIAARWAWDLVGDLDAWGTRVFGRQQAE